MSDEIKLAVAPEETAQGDDSVMSETDFRIGYDNQEDPKVMVFNVPIQRCADDLELGSALVRGKLDEAKQIALKIIAGKRERKKMLTSLARPGGGRIPLGNA